MLRAGPLQLLQPETCSPWLQPAPAPDALPFVQDRVMACCMMRQRVIPRLQPSAPDQDSSSSTPKPILPGCVNEISADGGRGERLRMSLGSKAWRLRWSKLVMGVSVMRSGIALNRNIGLGMLLIFAQRSASKGGMSESAMATVFSPEVTY